jgi:hypothetical protein
MRLLSRDYDPRRAERNPVACILATGKMRSVGRDFHGIAEHGLGHVEVRDAVGVDAA